MASSRSSATGATVEQVLARPHSEVVKKYGEVNLTVGDLSRFQGEKWLNGECVESHMALYVDRYAPKTAAVASTFLWTSMESTALRQL